MVVAYCSAIPVEVDQVAANPVAIEESLTPNERPKRQFLAGLLIGKALGAGYGYGLGRSAHYGGYGYPGHYYGRPYGYGYGYLNLFNLNFNTRN